MGRTRSLTTGATTALGMVAATLAVLGTAVMSAGPAAASVTIDVPAGARAGTVELTGTVGVDPGEVTSVLYVMDATRSTATQRSESPQDCSGNGGAGGPEDDLNGDGGAGDSLDCEIAGVEALNQSLSSTNGLQVGVVAFADEAAAADLDRAGTKFVPPAATTETGGSRVSAVTRSVVRENIGLYTQKNLGGSGAGTAFNNAVRVALATMRTAPAGPKWIMFLSDGQAPIDDSVLGELAASDVRMRTFGIGADATCEPSGSLYKMATATGESCNVALAPAELAAGLTGSQPDAVNGVSVSIGDVAVAATVGAVGGWRARFTLGAGTYTATVKAVLASGRTETARRTFTVAPAPSGPSPTPPPPPGTVAPGPGALAATVIKVKRPKPTRAPLPSKVTGRVGSGVGGLTVDRALSGTPVQLQARRTQGADWTTMDSATVDRNGRFTLRWRPTVRLPLLQVVLPSAGRFAGSAAAVPAAPISACKVTKRGGGWSIACRTTARAGSPARLLDRGQVVDRAKVRRGTVKLQGKGKVGRHTIDIAVSKRRHVRLAL